MLSAIRELSEGYPIIIVGGIDTPKYLDNMFQYKLGNLKYIATQLQRYKFFLGVDSGVAAALALALAPDVPFGTHFCDDPDLLLDCIVCGDCFIDPLLAG